MELSGTSVTDATDDCLFFALAPKPIGDIGLKVPSNEGSIGDDECTGEKAGALNDRSVFSLAPNGPRQPHEARHGRSQQGEKLHHPRVAQLVVGTSTWMESSVSQVT